MAVPPRLYGAAMGKNNKARRAAKARAKERARRERSSAGRRSHHSGFAGDAGGGGWQNHDARYGGPTDEELRDAFTGPQGASNMLLLAADAKRAGEEPVVAEAVGQLRSMDPSVVDSRSEVLLAEMVDACWQGGWQPAELHRQARLGCGTAAAGRLAGWAIADDRAGRRPATMDHRWMIQIDELDLPEVNGRPGWVHRWANDEALGRTDALTGVVDALANLSGLPRLERVLPPPGDFDVRTHDHDETRAASADPVLERIRNLLAKAESTNYEAEATALTAKAQELMTRHAVDTVLVQGDHRGDETPVIVRVPVDPPYVDAKSLLLQTVAHTGRCRAMMLTGLAMSTLVGFADDVAAVELLFTSLLVQAQTAVAEAARNAPRGTRTRSQSYRSSFLMAYTQRIGDRLAEINDAVYAATEAETGTSFLPMLRSREAEIDDYVSERFGELSQSAVRAGRDAAGWASGRVAADNARLNAGDIDDGAPADDDPHKVASNGTGSAGEGWNDPGSKNTAPTDAAAGETAPAEIDLRSGADRARGEQLALGVDE